MAYNLSKLKAPRLTGTSLKLFAEILESTFPGRIIIKKLMNDSGIPFLQNKDITHGPTMYPLHPKSDDLRKSDGVDIESFSQTVVQDSQNDGFHYPAVDDYASAYGKGVVSPIDVAQRIIDFIGKDGVADPLRGMIKMNPEELLSQAQVSQKLIMAGTPRSIFEGVPVAVKDEIDVIPYTTGVGTSFLGSSPAKADAAVVERLRAAGALIIGKSNMHEIGIGVTGVNTHNGTSLNPHDPRCYTGGSSSGSAAVVAAGYCPVAVGADGGGSIRIPSALCGVTGLKPTFGRVSERGAAPLCWSVAHLGPIASSVRDTALLYSLMAGIDPEEPLTHHQPSPNLYSLDGGSLKGIRLGIYPDWFYDCREDLHELLKERIRMFQELGAEIVEVDIPELEEMRVAQLVTIVSEMTTAMNPYYKKHRKDFGLDVRTNLALGRYFTNVDYIHAQRMRTRAIEIFNNVLSGVDGILTPTTAVTSPVMGKDVHSHGESDLGLLSEIMRFVTPANLTGLPAITVPVGYDKAGMPLGLHIIGRAWDEAFLLKTAAIIEQNISLKKPQVFRSPLE